MKLIAIDDVKEYMILARNVYDDFGKVLLSKETVLTSNYIDRLKNFGITSVYVIDGLTSDVDIRRKDQTQNEAPEIPLDNELPKMESRESSDTMLEAMRFTNYMLNNFTGELGSETPFMTTNMTNSQAATDFRPLLTHMEKRDIEFDFNGVTTNMRGGGINPDPFFFTWTLNAAPLEQFWRMALFSQRVLPRRRRYKPFSLKQKKLTRLIKML
ncbi:MAG: hypothetical protein K6U80_13710 [Firmicutes bacterium]|nr:hypothetical protein [Bacillota bacterium]